MAEQDVPILDRTVLSDQVYPHGVTAEQAFHGPGYITIIDGKRIGGNDDIAGYLPA